MKKIAAYIRWFWKTSEGVHGLMVMNVIFGCLVVAMNLIFIWTGKLAVDLASGDASIEGLSEPLVWACAALVLVSLMRMTVGAWNSRLASLASAKLTFILRGRLFSSLLQSQWQGKDKIHTGDSLNRVMTDSDAIVSLACHEFPNFIVTLVQLGAAFIFLASLNLSLAVVIIIVVPPLFFFAKYFYRTMRGMNKGIKERESQIQSHLQESLQHKTVIQTMDKADFVEGQLSFLQNDEYGKIVKRTGFSVFARVILSSAFMAGYLIAFIWGVFGISRGMLTYGLMTAFLQLAGQIQGPIRRLSEQLPSFVSATTSADRLRELESAPKEERGEPQVLDGPLGISVDHLTFRYPDGEEDIFRDFSWDFKPGSRTAVAGETGVGKSTLIRLMLALLRPDSGHIWLYERSMKAEVSPLAETSPATRINFVYVPQGNSLFSGTIRENLQMGDPAASEEKMWNALDTAAAGFVRELPDGLDTVCGEAGAGLSEGQAQRIAIARGLLRPGKIMLLDEFSSSLDPQTETTLMENLTGGNKDKTMIFITHHERIADYCDSILRLDKMSPAPDRH